jgi:hypothetical protein
MIEVVEVNMHSYGSRLGVVKVKYYDLVLICDLCLYRKEKLWIRMPEMWTANATKKRFVFWEDKEKSDEFQQTVLLKVKEMVGLTLEDAVELKQSLLDSKKR